MVKVKKEVFESKSDRKQVIKEHYNKVTKKVPPILTLKNINFILKIWRKKKWHSEVRTKKKLLRLGSDLWIPTTESLKPDKTHSGTSSEWIFFFIIRLFALCIQFAVVIIESFFTYLKFLWILTLCPSESVNF